jgi:zinc and cadmium transporter
MSVLSWIIAFSVLGSLLSVGMAAGYLLLPEKARVRSLSALVSFATGVLLGVAFVHLLPHALDHESNPSSNAVMMTVLFGIFVFFILEKALIWRHAHHHGDEESHEERGAHSAGALIVVGDTFHNFLDGVLLTAAFVTDIQVGIATGIASLAMVIGALLAWWGIQYVQAGLPYILAFTAASFIYIAVADLIPALHRGIRLKDTIAQLTLISAGILLIIAFQQSHIV